MRGHVKGVLFADYVRMLRANRGRSGNEFLEPEDLPFLHRTIALDEWCPMDSFERLGLAIFQGIAEGDLGPGTPDLRRQVEAHPERLVEIDGELAGGGPGLSLGQSGRGDQSGGHRGQ